MVTRRPKQIARQIFAGNVRRHRVARGMSQEGLAAAAKLHRTYVGSIERGERNVSIDNMDKLATALGVSLSELLREVAQ
ncbi:MAG: helix-turn-helix transcriptional regulator [Planctomycetes bacterium]|nr:helix-turn-helix transcriptional regulator [Planctomycetota bacterium]